MSNWSPADAIALERRHILEAGIRIARQKALRKELIGKGYNQLVVAASELLDLLRESLELSRERLRYLEDHYGSAPEPPTPSIPPPAKA
jgi:hypothetical protein